MKHISIQFGIDYRLSAGMGLVKFAAADRDRPHLNYYIWHALTHRRQITETARVHSFIEKAFLPDPLPLPIALPCTAQFLILGGGLGLFVG